MATAGTPPPPPDNESWGAFATKYGITDASATDYANRLFGEGSLGRLTDSYKGQTDANLARLQAGLGGLSAQENQAMMEQGQQNVANEMAKNQERYASAAGAHGIGGGAAAALQGRAFRQANQDTAAYNRQMILDNINQKNLASQNYTGALSGASDRALGIGQFNIGQQNAELYGRTSLPLQIGSSMNADDAGNWSKYYGGQMLGISQQGVDAAKAAADASTAAANQPPPVWDKGSGVAPTWDQGTKMGKDDLYSAAMGDTPPAFTTEVAKSRGYQTFKDWYKANPDQAGGWLNTQKDTMDAHANDVKTTGFNTGTGGTIICTEAHHQKLITDDDLATTRLFRVKAMTMSQYKGYLRWAKPVVAKMQQSALVSSLVMLFLPRLIKAMEWRLGMRPTASLGERMVLVAVQAMNWLGSTSTGRNLRKYARE